MPTPPSLRTGRVKQQVVQKFFARKVLFSWKTAKLDSFLPRVGEAANISKICWRFRVEAAWHTVLSCCTMCGTEQPREQPEIGDRGYNPIAVNQFLVFFL